MRSFEAFSDHDFELFMADLLGAEDEVRYEVFARGPDRGIDLRHIPEGGGLPAVVQCKRYIDSSFSNLKRVAKREAEVLSQLDPAPGSYRFVTTLRLTPDRKRVLAAILSDFVDGEQDIVGADDIEVLLDENAEVERRHPKLWLTGGIQLDAVLHGGIYERSHQLLVETQEALARYVETRAFFTARERLRKERALIIAGPPGIGKTTLARMLLADAALDGFQPIEISADAEEANEVFRSAERQAFCYDDFLGTTFLQSRLAKNEDKRITQLIRRVVASKTSLFVMTTREHILKQALDFYEELEREGIDSRRYLLELGEYTRLDRARIFYNHIWCSEQLDDRAREALVSRQGYERVLDHPNYNPRLIEHITGLGSQRLSEQNCGDYLDFAAGILDDPSLIWRHAFEHQLDETQRGMLVVLASMQTRVELTDLEAAFRAYCAAAGIEVRGTLFIRSLKVLDNSFIATRQEDGKTFAEPANPSIVDFIAEWLKESSEEAIFAVEGAAFFAQLEWLAGSVVGAVPASVQSALHERLATAVEVLFDSAEPCWELVRWQGRRDEVMWPVSHEPCERLVFVISLLGEYPGLRPKLEAWFAEQLVQECDTWSERHIPDEATPVGLVHALREAGRESEGVARRAKDHLSRNLTRPYAWRQLLRLRDLEPGIFEIREWADLQGEFQGFAGEMIANYEDIEDLEAVGEIESLAEDVGVELVEEELEFARDEVARTVAEHGNEIDWHDEMERSRLPTADKEQAQIDALFGRLALTDGV